MDEQSSPPQHQFSPEEWEQVKDLVFEAQQNPPADLHEWLQSHAVSAKIRNEVERLVRSSANCGDFMQKTVVRDHLDPSTRPPEKIGRYQVIESIGSGGAGVVYAALDPELDRRVAIKVLLADSARDVEQQKRLRWDAKAASALQHPNIVTVHEIGSDQGLNYVVMECIQGRTLARAIPPGGMKTEDALNCAIQVAAGLEAAHAARITHRDLKPGNIMITEGGTVKILDFGLAKLSAPGGRTGDFPATIEGTFAGTVAYVSPEQAEGRGVDARSDIFSFGVVLFEMLTGRRAFAGDSNMTVLADIIHRDPPNLLEVNPKIDPRLDDIVRRCLRKKREYRIQSIAEVKIRLQEIENEFRQSDPERTATHQVVTRRTPGFGWGLVTGAAAVAIVAGAAALLTRTVEPPIVIRRATSDVGMTAYPAVSRDGKFLAFASERESNDNLDIYVQQSSTADPFHLTRNAADDYEPEFSPEGTQIVYRSDRDGGGLYIDSTLGGSERLLVAGGRGPRFSPDGKWLAYWTGEIGGNFSPGSASIWIMPAAGGHSTQFRPDFDAAAFPVWAPKGDRLLFLGRANGSDTKDWWVASIDQSFSHATGLLRSFSARGLRPVLSYFLTPSQWLADSDQVLFAAAHEDSSNIWAVPISRDGVASSPARRWTAGTAIEMQPAVVPTAGSRAGRSFAYTALTQSIAIWRQAVNARGEPSGKPSVLVSGIDGLSSPSLNADGSKLVFAARRPSGQFVRLMDLKTGVSSVVADVGKRHVARPVLSGDGRTVAYCDGAAGYVREMPGGAPVLICKSCGPPTHLSYDGREVLFESAGPLEQILISTGRNPPRPLIRVAGVDPRDSDQYAARFSPGERWVVFHAVSKQGRRQIWIAPVRREGTVAPDELIPVTEGTYVDEEPYWSPDGGKIYFLSNRDGVLNVWARAVDPATARPRGPAFRVTDYNHARHLLRGATVYSGDIGLSVAGGFLVYALSDFAGNIWTQSEAPAN